MKTQLNLGQGLTSIWFLVCYSVLSLQDCDVSCLNIHYTPPTYLTRCVTGLAEGDKVIFPLIIQTSKKDKRKLPFILTFLKGHNQTSLKHICRLHIHRGNLCHTFPILHPTCYCRSHTGGTFTFILNDTAQASSCVYKFEAIWKRKDSVWTQASQKFVLSNVRNSVTPTIRLNGSELIPGVGRILVPGALPNILELCLTKWSTPCTLNVTIDGKNFNHTTGHCLSCTLGKSPPGQARTVRFDYRENGECFRFGHFEYQIISSVVSVSQSAITNGACVVAMHTVLLMSIGLLLAICT